MVVMAMEALVEGLSSGKWAPSFFVYAAKKFNKMSQLQTIPFRFQENELNVIQLNDEPWFMAKEVASILDYRNTNDATRILDEDEKGTHLMRTLGGIQEISIINESGLYSLILRSKKPEAKQFKRWVTHEVLPSIRKHGAYLTGTKTEELLANPDLIIELATTLKEERKRTSMLLHEIDTRNEIIELQETSLKKTAPIVKYYEDVLNSESLISTNIIAKGLGMSAVTLNKILHQEYRFIYKQGKTWVPSAKIQHMGLHRLKTYTYIDSDGKPKTNVQLYWTEKGRAFIHQMVSSYTGK